MKVRKYQLRVGKYVSVRIARPEFKTPKGAFALFSALNAMGYDDENNIAGMAPVRKKVRDVLLKHHWDKKYPSLQRVFDTYHPWHLLRAVFAEPESIKRTSALGGLIRDLEKFSKEPLMRRPWKIFKTYQAKVSKRLFSLFTWEATRLMTFISRSPKRVKKIVLVFNPLDAYWRGYGIKLGEVGYVVVGPGAADNQCELVRHELLHILAPSVQVPKGTIVPSRHRHLAALGYGDQRTVRREYVIRSLNLLYESTILKKDISRAVRREEKNFPCIRKILAFVRRKKEGGYL